MTDTNTKQETVSDRDRDFMGTDVMSIPLRDGIVLSRAVSGRALTNVPRLVTHHSPDGFEFGYGGSGPSDLALNMLEAVLREIDYRGETTNCCKSGRCFALAWQYHQDAKWQFLAKGGTYRAIPFAEVERWIRARMEQEAKTDAGQ